MGSYLSTSNPSTLREAIACLRKNQNIKASIEFIRNFRWIVEELDPQIDEIAQDMITLRKQVGDFKSPEDFQGNPLVEKYGDTLDSKEKIQKFIKLFSDAPEIVERRDTLLSMKDDITTIWQRINALLDKIVDVSQVYRILFIVAGLGEYIKYTPEILEIANAAMPKIAKILADINNSGLTGDHFSSGCLSTEMEISRCISYRIDKVKIDYMLSELDNIEQNVDIKQLWLAAERQKLADEHQN